jgi:hypothetical protein
MKAEITVPTSLSEIPLLNYQKFMKMAKNSNDSEFIAQKTIEIFCGLQLKDVLNIKYSSVVDLSNHFAKLFNDKPAFKNRFKIDNIEFGFIPNLEDMTFGEYIDLESNISDIDNFHKAMAVMYRPVTKTRKENYEIMPYTGTSEFSDVMKYASMDIVLGASLFFWNLGNDLVQISLTYLEQEMKKNKEIKRTFQNALNSQNSGDGTTQSMQSLKATLQSLMTLPNWGLENVLHGSLTSDKKQKLNKEKLIEN